MSQLFHDPANKQLNWLDDRYYCKKDTDIYYPSVTTVLDAIDKGKQFHIWQKQLGFNADLVMKQAGEFGTKIHNAIDAYLSGTPIMWADEKGNAQYTYEEWMCLLRFMDFWRKYKPKVIAAEVRMVSDIYKIGGTADLICEINGQTWLVDYKTANSLHDTYELQLAAYAMMWNSINPDHFIQRCGILHLKAATRGEDKKKKKIQGYGWTLHEYESHYKHAFKRFQAAQQVWEFKNPTYKPSNLVLPDRFIPGEPAITATTLTGYMEHTEATELFSEKEGLVSSPKDK